MTSRPRPRSLRANATPPRTGRAADHALAIALAALLIVLVSSPFAAAAADYGRVATSTIAPGIYLFTTTPYGDAGFGGNAVAIVSDGPDGGVVLFDTSGTPASGE